MIRLEIRDEHLTRGHREPVYLAGYCHDAVLSRKSAGDRELGMRSRRKQSAEARIVQNPTDLLDHALAYLRAEQIGSAREMPTGGVAPCICGNVRERLQKPVHKHAAGHCLFTATAPGPTCRDRFIISARRR